MHVRDVSFAIHDLAEVSLSLFLFCVNSLAELFELIPDVSLTLIKRLLHLSNLNLSVYSACHACELTSEGVVNLVLKMIHLLCKPANRLLPVMLTRRYDLLDELSRLLHIPLAVLLQGFELVPDPVTLVHCSLCIGLNSAKPLIHFLFPALSEHSHLCLVCCDQGLTLCTYLVGSYLHVIVIHFLKDRFS